MHETTFEHKFILGDPVRIKKDTTQKEYMIQSVSCCFEMERINKQIIWSKVVIYTIMGPNFDILGTPFLETDLEKRELKGVKNGL
jgi:hypothetical protein